METLKEHYKFIHISDLHLGRHKSEEDFRRFLSEEIPLIYNTAQNYAKDLDGIVFSGDLFDKRLSGDDPELVAALAFVTQLVLRFANTHVLVLIIRGTWTHDEDMLHALDHLTSIKGSTLKIVDTKMEYIRHNGLLIRALPELKEVDYLDFRRRMKEEKADVTFFHGSVEEVLWAVKNSDSMNQMKTSVVIKPEDLVNNTLIGSFGGHFHKPMKVKDYPIHYGGVFTNLSFDETDKPGFQVIDLYPMTNSYTINRIVNDRSLRMNTIDIPDFKDLSIKEIQARISIVLMNKHPLDRFRIKISYYASDVLTREKLNTIRQTYPSIKIVAKLLHSDEHLAELKSSEEDKDILTDKSVSLATKIKYAAEVNNVEVPSLDVIEHIIS